MQIKRLLFEFLTSDGSEHGNMNDQTSIVCATITLLYINWRRLRPRGKSGYCNVLKKLYIALFHWNRAILQYLIFIKILRFWHRFSRNITKTTFTPRICKKCVKLKKKNTLERLGKFQFYPFLTQIFFTRAHLKRIALFNRTTKNRVYREPKNSFGHLDLLPPF